MGWTRLKLILAAVLLAANGILLVCVISLYRSTEYLPEDALRRVSVMLAENGISVAESAIDGKKTDLVIYEGELGEDYYTNTAEALSGSITELSFSTPTGYVMTMENGDRLAFSGGFGIRFERAQAPEFRALSELSDESLTALTASDERRLSRAVGTFLGAAEPSLPDTQALSLSRELLYSGEDAESGIHYCVCAQYARNTRVFSFVSAFAVYENTVIGMTGEWCFSQMDTSYSAQLMDQVNILYSVKDRVLEERAEDGTTVAGIRALTIGYAAYFRSDSDRFYLIPAWNAEMDGGKKYIINAVDGTIYTN